MLSDELNGRAGELERASDDPMVRAVVLLARAVNELNWNMTYIKKAIQSERDEVQRIRQLLERREVV